MKSCNVCNYKYDNEVPHYCINCGTNLSSEIEKTDVVLFFSKFFKILGLIGFIIFTYPLVSCAINPFCIDGHCIGSNYSFKDWLLIITPIIFIITGFILKKIFKKICLENKEYFYGK